MKKNLDEIVNRIYVISYTNESGNAHQTSFLTEKRAKEHMIYLIDQGAKCAQIHEINLWME